MSTGFVVTAVFGIFAILLCWFKPDAGRIFMGIFFLLMGIGIHGAVVLTDPNLYIAFADTTYLPIYRWLLENVVAISPVLFGILALLFEVMVALLILSKGREVTYGIVLSILLMLGLTPLGNEELACPLIAVAMALLLRKSYPRSLPDMVYAWLAPAGRRSHPA